MTDEDLAVTEGVSRLMGSAAAAAAASEREEAPLEARWRRVSTAPTSRATRAMPPKDRPSAMPSCDQG